jgi:hypothetical protein
LLSSKIDAKKLRMDSNFYDKIMSLYTSYFSNEGIVTKQAINHMTSIFVYLLSKVKPN